MFTVLIRPSGETDLDIIRAVYHWEVGSTHRKFHDLGYCFFYQYIDKIEKLSSLSNSPVLTCWCHSKLNDVTVFGQILYCDTSTLTSTKCDEGSVIMMFDVVSITIIRVGNARIHLVSPYPRMVKHAHAVIVIHLIIWAEMSSLPNLFLPQ